MAFAFYGYIIRSFLPFRFRNVPIPKCLCDLIMLHRKFLKVVNNFKRTLSCDKLCLKHKSYCLFLIVTLT